jgi:N-acetylmuramoyl-L-alanine amidase
MARIVLDPGHGGTKKVGGSSPNNATGPAGTKEKDLALAVALVAFEALKADGHEVRLTRDSDVNLGLAARAAVARELDAHGFVSIHFNGFSDPKAQGTETWLHTDHAAESARLADAVQAAVLEATLLRDRGVKEKQLGVLDRKHHADGTACCLAEISFLTDPAEESRLANAEYRHEVGQALARGVERFLAAAASFRAARTLAVSASRGPAPPPPGRPIRPATERPLQVFAFDPGLGRRHGNHARLTVSYEPLEPGPRGRRVAVVDYDASNDCYYEPVDLDDPQVLLQGGLFPSESDPRFHQQMAYAVVSRTIDLFGAALGRPIRWRTDRPLRVFPHALQEANAFYDAKRHALLFGYFRAGGDGQGILPGQTVFTCLSNDIVVHETAHALLHDVRRHFMQPTGPDTLAFHEAFADVVALVQHFTYREAVVDHILRTGGVLFRPELAPIVAPAAARTGVDATAAAPSATMAELAQRNILVGLAQQFGEAMGLRAALRSSLGAAPDPSALERALEPHDRGAVLVAAVFDAFYTVYAGRMADLLRIAGIGAGAPAGALTVDLAGRLAAEAAKTARHFLTMCIRALDYCPPVDISFGDYLRALITADADLVPDDDLGYRDVIIEAFRRRGIRPTGVASYSESSLRWDQPSGPDGAPLVCPALDFDLLSGTTSRAVMEENARRLHAFAAANHEALQLRQPTPGGPTVWVSSFHPVSRVGPDGQLRYQIVAELLQQHPADEGAPWRRRGGTTIMVDARTGIVQHAIYKRLRLPEEQDRHREFRAWIRFANPYRVRDAAEIDFAAVHRGF